MREIKFRLWDKYNKCMNYGDIEFLTPMDSEDENSIIMQFTGLKDKNGKEIYEGDIVVLDHPDYFEAKENFTVTSEQFFHDVSYLSGMDAEHIEVIGNIYENGDLLGTDRKEGRG